LEIIVVDNGSTDGSVGYVRGRYAGVEVVELGTNRGVGAGYMAGVYRAKGDYVALLSNDMAVEPSWVDHFLDALERNHDAVAAEPKYMNYYQRNRFEDVASAGRWIDRYGNNYTRGVNEVDHGQYDSEAYVFVAVTFFLRKALLELGGFDPFYFWGYEDIDLGWRIYMHRWRIVYVPRAIIFHKSGGTTRSSPSRRLNPHLYYLVKRNRLITLWKNYSYANAVRATIVASVEYVGTAIYYSYKRNPAYSKSLLKALTFVLRNLQTVLRLRYKAQSTRRAPDSEIVKFMKPYTGDLLKLVISQSSEVKSS
jgi:hypothetical protein